MKNHRERRAHPRYTCRIPVQVSAPDREVSASTFNISLGGMLLEMAEPLPFGTAVKLRFALPDLDSNAEVEAVVRWNTASAVGVQFRSLRAIEVWALNRLFKTLESD